MKTQRNKEIHTFLWTLMQRNNWKTRGYDLTIINWKKLGTLVTPVWHFFPLYRGSSGREVVDGQSDLPRLMAWFKQEE